MSFGENLQYLRRREALTQEALAERLEVSRQTVSKWESDSCYPEMEKLLQLCDMFRTDLDTLLRGDLEKSQVADTAQYDRTMNVFTWQVALSVGAIIAAVALGGLMEEVLKVPEMLCGAFLLLVVTVAVVVLVAGCIQRNYFAKKNPVIADFYTQAERDAFHRRFVWCVAGGVGAILFAVVLMCLVFAFVPEEGVYASCAMAVFLLIIAAAVTAFIYAGLQNEKYNVAHYNRDNNPSPAVKARRALLDTICAVLMTLTVAVYVGLGLTQDSWSRDWWIFAVGGILCGVVAIVLDPDRLAEK